MAHEFRGVVGGMAEEGEEGRRCQCTTVNPPSPAGSSAHEHPPPPSLPSENNTQWHKQHQLRRDALSWGSLNLPGPKHKV